LAERSLQHKPIDHQLQEGDEFVTAIFMQAIFAAILTPDE
jgi:hypothetical protein